MENPLCDFAQILKNSKATTNKRYLKKYLDELVAAKSVIYLPVQKKYLTSTISDDKKTETGIPLLEVLIDDAIRKNSEIRNNEFLIASYRTPKIYYFDYKSFNDYSLHERVFVKYLILWRLKLEIFKADLKKVQKNINPLIVKKLEDSVEMIMRSGKELLSFVENYPKFTKEYLLRLENDLETEWQMDLIYVNKLLYNTRPLYEILRIAIADLIFGTKEASKFHLELRRNSRYRHGDLPEESKRKHLDKKRKEIRNESSSKGLKKRIEEFEKKYAKLIAISHRKYPKKLTNTKALISSITDSHERPDENKLISYYLSELGRVNRTETPYEFIKLYLNAWGLRHFLNTAPNTPKNIKNKRKIQSIFDKLQDDV